MLNYIKSEFYRLISTKMIYFITAITMAVALLMNIVLGIFRMHDANFLYATTSFSYSQIVANPILFAFMGMMVAIFLYEGNRRNGNLKNTVSFGLSRIKIFTSMCIVATITAVMIMLFVIAAYIISAQLLLKQTGPVRIDDLLTEVIALFFIAIAGVVSALLFLELFKKSTLANFLLFVIWFVIPDIVANLGLKVEIFKIFAMLFPKNLFREMQVNMMQSLSIWSTSEGMLKCVVMGVAHIIFFYTLAYILLRKKDV